MRNWYDAALCPAQNPELSGSRPLVDTTSCRFYDPFLHQHREISTFVLVPVNDLRTDARFYGASLLFAQGHSAAFNLTRASTVVFLPCSYFLNSPFSGTSRVPPVRTRGVAVSGAWDFLVGNLAWPSSGLRLGVGLGRDDLAAGARSSMADLPMVRSV